MGLHHEPKAKPENPGISIAKIYAWQAIVVALISSISGVVGYYLRDAMSSKQDKTATIQTQPQLHYLKITGIEGLGADYSVRLVMDVNGRLYSYPSKEVWANLGSDISNEEFLLEPSDAYKINFSAWVQSSEGGVTQLDSQSASPTSTISLPVNESFELKHQVNRTGQKTSSRESLTIQYSLR